MPVLYKARFGVYGEEVFRQDSHREKYINAEKTVVCRFVYKPIKTKITGAANEKNIYAAYLFSLILRQVITMAITTERRLTEPPNTIKKWPISSSQ